MPVEHSPFDKKGAFVATQHIFILVLNSPVPQFAAAHAPLYFPARHIGVNEDIARANERRSRPIDDNQLALMRGHLLAKFSQFIGDEEFAELVAGNGLAPIFPYTFYHLTHYWFAAADIPVANDTPVHYADAIRCNVRRPPQGSLPLLTRRVSA